MPGRERPQSERERLLDEAQHQGYLHALDNEPNQNPYGTDPHNFDNDGPNSSEEEWLELRKAYDDSYNYQKNLKK